MTKPTPEFVALMRRRREEIRHEADVEFALVRELVSGALDFAIPDDKLDAYIRVHWQRHVLALPVGWKELYLDQPRRFSAQNSWLGSHASGRPHANGDVDDVGPVARLLVRLRMNGRARASEVTP